MDQEGNLPIPRRDAQPSNIAFMRSLAIATKVAQNISTNGESGFNVRSEDQPAADDLAVLVNSDTGDVTICPFQTVSIFVKKNQCSTPLEELNR